MHYKQVANRRKEKWQTGGRDKCHSAAKPIEFLKVWLIRIPRFCVDDSNSVPNLPLPMKNIGKKAPGSFIHKLYGLRSPDPLHKRVGEPDYPAPGNSPAPGDFFFFSWIWLQSFPGAGQTCVAVGAWAGDSSMAAWFVSISQNLSSKYSKDL